MSFPDITQHSSLTCSPRLISPGEVTRARLDPLKKPRAKFEVADTMERIHQGEEKEQVPAGMLPRACPIICHIDCCLGHTDRRVRLPLAGGCWFWGPAGPGSTWQPQGLRGSILQHTCTWPWNAIWIVWVYLRYGQEKCLNRVWGVTWDPAPWGMGGKDLFPVPFVFTCSGQKLD